MSFVAVAVTTAAIAGGLTAYGAHEEGVAQRKQFQFQSDMATVQQQLAVRNAEQNTTLVQLQAADQSKQAAAKARAIAGAQTVAGAANGTAGSVTANDISLDTFDTAKLDQLNIQYNANLKSWGIKENLGGELWNLDAMKQQYSFAGKNAVRASNIKVASTIIGTASQMATAGIRYGGAGQTNPGGGGLVGSQGPQGNYFGR